MKLLGTKVLILPEEEVQEGVIKLNSDKPKRGKVIATGVGIFDPPTIGSTVLYKIRPNAQITDVMHEGNKCLLIKESDLLGELI